MNTSREIIETVAKINSTGLELSKLETVAAGTDGLSAGTIQATFQTLATRTQALENVAAGDDGLEAGTLQETLQALATRIQELEDAAEDAPE